MKLEKHTYWITGISPLLTHNPGSMVHGSIMKVGRKQDTPAEEAEKGLYRVTGGYGIPAISLRAALLSGCKGVKVGKVGLMSVIAPAVVHTEEFCTLLDPKTKKPLVDYKIDTRRVGMPSGGSVVRCRPRFEEWACRVTFEVDVDYVPDTKVVLQYLNVGGIKAGVGDYRPECTGWFGKFKAEESK